MQLELHIGYYYPKAERHTFPADREVAIADNTWISGSWAVWGPDDQGEDKDHGSTRHVVVNLDLPDDDLRSALTERRLVAAYDEAVIDINRALINAPGFIFEGEIWVTQDRDHSNIVGSISDTNDDISFQVS